MSAAARVRAARNAIVAAWECSRSALGDPATEAAQALEDRALLQSPETTAELERLQSERESSRVDGQRLLRAEQRRAELEAVLGEHRADDRAEIERLRARLDEAERKYTLDTAELKKQIAAERAEHSDAHDDLAHALGRGIGTEWSDLISIAASGVGAEETAQTLQARVAELEAAVKPAATEQWLAGYGFAREQMAAAIDRGQEPPQAADELGEGAPTQVIPVVDDVPIPVVLTEADGPSVANNASARAAGGGLRRLLHPLDPGVRS